MCLKVLDNFHFIVAIYCCILTIQKTFHGADLGWKTFDFAGAKKDE